MCCSVALGIVLFYCQFEIFGGAKYFKIYFFVISFRFINEVILNI
jgi:hypothetical protein